MQRALFLVLLLCVSWVAPAQVIPRNYAVEVSAAIDGAARVIRLQWIGESSVTNLTVSRRSSTEEAWKLLANLPPDATAFQDADVLPGRSYEYQILKKSSAGYTGAGYIAAGWEVPPIFARGRILILVEHELAGGIAEELDALTKDMVGDGWVVTRREVSRDSAFSDVRGMVQAEYSAGLRALLLLGHVPVPYSGNINPDGHANHRGAWPADVFYAEMNSSWNDISVTATNAERDVNWNVPGDGKFDPSTLPSDVELETGRVDLSDLTCFANKASPRSELDLTRQYLRKNHAWRQGDVTASRRGLIFDAIGLRGRGPLADSGWRNFTPFFGPENVFELTGEGYFSRLSREDYLWTYAAGGGTYTSADGVGTSDDFALNDVQAVFTMFIGSYFGDWNNESNFLRAALGSGKILTASWTGYPHWFYHHMALGETIGFSTRLTQNNSTNGPYLPSNGRARQVHIALMGDPTLRMHSAAPPSHLVVSRGSNGVALVWEGSRDPDVSGYFVLRAEQSSGPFILLNGTAISERKFADASGVGGVYMVRAVKLERDASGSYYNLSEGVVSNRVEPAGGAPPRLTISSPGGSVLELGLSNLSSGTALLERSADLRNWLVWKTQGVTGSALAVTNRSDWPEQFFRIRNLSP